MAKIYSSWSWIPRLLYTLTLLSFYTLLYLISRKKIMHIFIFSDLKILKDEAIPHWGIACIWGDMRKCWPDGWISTPTLKMAMTRQSTSLGAYPLAWWPPPLVDKTGSIYHRSAGGDEDAFSGLMGIIQTMMGLHLLDVHNSKNTPKWPQYISPTNSRHLSSSTTTTNKFKTFCAARVRGEGRYLIVLGKGSLKKKKKIREFSLMGGGAFQFWLFFPNF